MEWVETAAPTLSEAIDIALDQLGVDEKEAEIQVLEEPRSGLFGRTRGQARVRARVAPRLPRPKAVRRPGGRKRAESKAGNTEGKGAKPGGSGSAARADNKAAARGPAKGPAKASGGGSGDAAEAGTAAAGKKRASSKRAAAPDKGSETINTDQAQEGTAGEKSVEDQAAGSDVAVVGAAAQAKKRSRKRASPRGSAGGGDADPRESNGKDTGKKKGDDMSAEAIAESVEEYLNGLLDAMDLDGVSIDTEIDGDEVTVSVNGDDLGHLIGPKGQTLQALQDLTRISLNRSTQDRDARVHLDVAGYRRKRREALARFAAEQAKEALESGEEIELEPMGPADRKVVHDTINEIEGVSTTSEGREGSRRVVIIPD